MALGEHTLGWEWAWVESSVPLPLVKQDISGPRSSVLLNGVTQDGLCLNGVTQDGLCTGAAVTTANTVVHLEKGERFKHMGGLEKGCEVTASEPKECRAVGPDLS